MKKKYYIGFAAIAVALVAIILFVSAIMDDRELLLGDLWKGKEISRIVIVREDGLETVLSEAEMESFFSDFGSEKIRRVQDERITGWTHGVRMYDEEGNQVVFISFLGTRISAWKAGYYECAASEEELYNKLALYE